jgi:coiled-coil and C2 domain-containing protein 2A
LETKATTRKLTEILIPTPDDDEIYNEAEITSCTFSSKRLQRRNSNTRFSSFRRSSRSKLINTSGNITVIIGWTNSEEANGDSENLNDTKIVKKTDPFSAQNELISQGVLQKWFDQKLLNPLDPDAKNLVQFIINGGGEEAHKLDSKSTTTAKDSELFRFNEDELAFCTEEEFNSIERFHLLKARHDNDLSYKNKKLIPQLERELSLDKDRDTNIIDESLIADPIDLQRFRGRKYLRCVYEIITNHCENLNRDKMNTNILIGDEFPTFGSLSLAFFEMFGPKRPLKPTRRVTSSRTSCKINEVTNFNIVVTVVRATNVPIRCDETQTSSRKSSTLSTPGASKFTPFKHSNVHPHVFVAISLKDHHHTCRTSSAEGTNPMWNEQLSLPFNINSDDSKRCLSIDLYDEVVEDLIDNVSEVYQRITSKWLGTLKIPVINICSNQRIEGTFELFIPAVLVGYTKAKFSPADQQTAIAIENLPDMSKKTYISLFISLEPAVEIPQLISSGLECIEVIHVEQHIKLWFEQLKLEFPTRTQKWSPLVTLLSGKRACITRLLSALAFPFDKGETTEQLIRRFVSLIPIQHDASTTHSSCTGLNGVWLSNNVR